MTTETARITVPSAMTLGSDLGEAQLAPDVERQRRLGAGEEEGDDEFVEGGQKGEHEGRGDGGRRERQHDPAERRPFVSAEIHRRFAKASGMAAKRPRMMTTVVGSATSIWPSTMAMRDGPRPTRLTRISSAMPTMTPGIRIGRRAEAQMYGGDAPTRPCELHIGDGDAAAASPRPPR